jgi:GNAT superfamily N-acetyltransferase
MADYGQIKLKTVKTSGTFMDLYKEILSDPDWKGDPLLSMLDEWKNNSLYTLTVSETDSMFERRACSSEEFIRGNHQFCCLPACLSLDINYFKDSIVINFLWVHPRARGKGYARMLIVKMLAELEGDYDNDKVFISHPVDNAKGFWSHMCCYPTDNQYIWKMNVKELVG